MEVNVNEADDEAEYEVWQDGMAQAAASGPRSGAIREALHYATVYSQDGPVQIYEVTRRLITIDELEIKRRKGG